MLLRPDATFIDQATKRAERIFPSGSDWKFFESRFPEPSVFANTVLDPAVGVAGQLAVKTFASADWQNWVSTTKIAMFELSTRVGLPDMKDTSITQGLSRVYSTIDDTISLVEQFGDDPAELVPHLIQNAALQVVDIISGQSNMVGQTIAQVIAAAVWAVDVVRSKVEADLGKMVALPPLQTEDPATDTWQVNRALEVLRSRGSGGVVFPDGKVEAASNADYTSLYLPAYLARRPWQVQHRAAGIAAQQGSPQTARGPNGDAQYHFDPGDGSHFGFMPGTSTTLRVLQASYRLYQTTRSYGVNVDRYSLRCVGVDKPCYQSTKTFNGKRDCRQCVDAESVWPVKGIGWAYAGAPLNVTTPGENVGAFYPSTNKLLGNLLDMIAQPGPLLFTVDAYLMNSQWKDCFENFWEFARGEWARYRGVGWRGLISRLATMMTVFQNSGGALQPGGRHPEMPLSLIASPREGTFEVPFSASIYEQLIKPYCTRLVQLQRAELRKIDVAYIPPGAGALYTATGKIRRTDLGDKFEAARRELLSSNRRVLVQLQRVTDPEYREALRNSGVKESPVNPIFLGSPGVSGQLLRPTAKRPARAVKPPKPSRVPPLAGAAQLGQLEPGKLKVTRLIPGRLRSEPEPQQRRVAPAIVGVGLAAAAVTATTLAVRKLGELDEGDP